MAHEKAQMQSQRQGQRPEEAEDPDAINDFTSLDLNWVHTALYWAGTCIDLTRPFAYFQCQNYDVTILTTENGYVSLL
jgi:hypothetical protein